MPSILLVEDDDDVRSGLCEVLERAGYEVASAADGREALAHLERRPTPFALVILDWILPALSGAEVADHIAGHPVHAGTPIVVFSGHDRVPVGRGISAVVCKPVRKRTLVEVADRLAGMPPRAELEVTPPPSVTTTPRQYAPTVVWRTPRP